MNPASLDVSTTDGILDALISHGVTPADLRGITGEELEAVYRLAYDALEGGNVRQAFEQAAFLVGNDPWDRRFHVIAGVCLQQLGQFDAAYRSYTQALAFDATDAICTYRVGECLLAMGEASDAHSAFEAVVKLSWADPAYASVRDAALHQLDQSSGMSLTVPSEAA